MHVADTQRAREVEPGLTKRGWSAIFTAAAPRRARARWLCAAAASRHGLVTPPGISTPVVEPGEVREESSYFAGVQRGVILFVRFISIPAMN